MRQFELETKLRRFLIDTDTASDDAVALIMALRSPDVAVRGITTVAGNVHVKQATANALHVAELCGATEVPVYAGCDKPMLRPAIDANWFHGKDGLGDLGFAPVNGSPAAEHAVDAILDLSRRYPKLTLVTLGPLTNVAVALLRDPTLAQRVGRCVVMGGNPCCVGNGDAGGRIQHLVRSRGSGIVLRSGMVVELVGWHLCRGDAAMNASDIAATRSLGTKLANFAIDCNRTATAAYFEQTGEKGISLPDPPPWPSRSIRR